MITDTEVEAAGLILFGELWAEHAETIRNALNASKYARELEEERDLKTHIERVLEALKHNRGVGTAGTNERAEALIRRLVRERESRQGDSP
jgi:hypothetical protein